MKILRGFAVRDISFLNCFGINQNNGFTADTIKYKTQRKIEINPLLN
jgi:hypothetical protein